MRSSIAAAKRAELRRRAELVEQGVLNESYFQEGHVRKNESQRTETLRVDEEEDELMKPREKPKSKLKEKDTQDEDNEEALLNETDEVRKARAEWRKEVNDAQVEYTHEDELLQRQKEDRSSVPLMAFNLKEEEELGHFDESGAYIWRRRNLANEEDGEVDPWLQSLEPSDTVAQTSAATRKRKLSQDKSEQGKKKMSKEYYIQNAVRLLKENETVLDALKRLGKEKDKSSLNQMVDASSALLEHLPSVYQSTRRMLDAEIAPERCKRMDSIMWEYKLESGQVFGPYSATMLQAWRDQGYFSPEQNVVLRRVYTENPGETPARKKQKTASEELLDDFDEDEDRESDESNNNQQEKEERKEAEWIPSDQVDFRQVFFD